MTSKAALCKALLDGKVLNIMNGFKLLGITNVPREVGRSVERAFGVVVSRTERNGTTRYGQTCNWVDYRLNRTDYNKDGIEKMKKYVQEQAGTINPKTDNEAKGLKEAGFTPTEDLQSWFTAYQNEELPQTPVRPKQIDLFK